MNALSLLENKMALATIAAVAVIVLVAAAYVATSNDDGDDNGGGSTDSTYTRYLTKNSGSATVKSVGTKLVVFGNANNDVYLDSKDVDFIQEIVDGKSGWDSDANPLADTNADGAITQDDVSLLKLFLGGKNASMFYLDSYLDTQKIKFPMTGKIAVGGTNDVDMLRIFGMTDRVVCCSANVPDECKDVKGSSSWKTGFNYPYDYEIVVGSGATITLGQPYMYDSTFEGSVRKGYGSFPIDMVKLHEARLMNGIEAVACTVTLGALMNAYGHGTYNEFLKYAQNVEEIVEKATKNISEGDRPSYVLIIAQSSNDSAANLSIDNVSTDVENYGDVATVTNLGMVPAMKPIPNGYKNGGTTVEDILKSKPDVIFVEANVGDSYSDYTAKVSQISEYLIKAGYKGRIIGITYTVMGNAASTSALPLLASYVYGNKVYSESDAWNDLVTYYNTFLDGNYTVESIKKSIYGPYLVQ